MVNSEEGPGVALLFLFFARNILAQEVQRLISAMARHLLTSNHLQQREKNGFQVFRCICRGTDDMKDCMSQSVVLLKSTNSRIATAIYLLHPVCDSIGFS